MPRKPVDELYDAVTGRMENVRYLNSSSHILPVIFENIESELMIGRKYRLRIPATYPRGRGESMGYRSLHRASDAIFRGRRIRAGITEMHIRELKSERNLHSVFLLYTGNAEEVPFPHPVIGMKSNYPTFTSLHENGVISGGICASPSVSVIQSWYPEGKEGFGGLPYSIGAEEFDEIMTINLERAGAECASERTVLADLYFLASDVFGQSV